eukprot:TRINITY_DN2624_c0_g1_i1.p1 TRINITY_DN2624_c0_g1~~TRINITY_DN2624_c0_g1_i1.p1  ORF type:complete len:140 (+),score=42.73 TRINITY_DN2624_c0_g1_i1:116-535(+)
MTDTKENYCNQEHGVAEHPDEVVKNSENNEEATEQPEDHCMPSYEEEEMAIKKKYGGVVPKKPPLISKDHERAFFDSADWALGKQGGPMGQKPKGPLEALRPKLQPTPQQQVRTRRTSYAPHDGEDAAVISSEEANNNE